jgi:hypothetical protein
MLQNIRNSCGRSYSRYAAKHKELLWRSYGRHATGKSREGDGYLKKKRN